MKILFRVFLFIALSAAFPAIAAEKRVALVIGNAAYSGSPLANPVNDAQAISAKLKTLGFDVVTRENLATKQIGGALREFRSRLKPGDEALFFYAGHGLQIKGNNYLPAVDADIHTEEDVPNQSINVNQVLEIMEDSKTRLNLVFLDACRNNPFSRRFRSAEGGLAKIAAPSGTLISFATRPGSVASDGDGKNGLYTTHLLAQMDKPNIPIEKVLKDVVSGVKKASKGQQEPWMEGSIEGDFYFIFTGPATVNVSPPQATTTRIKTNAEIEQELWDSIKDAGSSEALTEYLKAYPKGRYLSQARILLAKLKKTAKPEPSSPQPAATVNAEDALWSAVEKGNSADDYDAYLSQHPNGKYAVLAKSRKQKLQTEAAAERERKELEQQQRAAAEEKRRTEAQERLDMQRKSETDKIMAQKGGKTYKARHILMTTREDAMDIIASLEKGKKFEELAYKSIDPGSKLRGGDLGWATPSAYVQPFSEAMVKLQKGMFTIEPVQTVFGWHVIFLEDERAAEETRRAEVQAWERQEAQRTEAERKQREAEVKPDKVFKDCPDCQWVEVPTSRLDELYFYDVAKLAINGNEITYWKKVLFKNSQAYKSQQVASALYRERIHCSENTVEPLGHILRDFNGAVIEQVASQGEVVSIIPDTIGDLFGQTLCPRVKDKPAGG